MIVGVPLEVKEGEGLDAAIRESEPLRWGLNVKDGEIVHPGAREAFKRD